MKPINYNDDFFDDEEVETVSDEDEDISGLVSSLEQIQRGTLLEYYGYILDGYILEENNFAAKCIMRIPRKYMLHNFPVVMPLNDDLKEYPIKFEMNEGVAIYDEGNFAKAFITKCSCRDNQSEDIDDFLRMFSSISYSSNFGYLLKNELCFLINDIIVYGDKIEKSLSLACIHRLVPDSFPQLILSKYDLPLWLSFLKTSIEVQFVDEEEMQKRAKDYIPKEAYNPDETLDFSKVPETLGFYGSKTYNKKEIVLCPERIERTAKDLMYSISADDLMVIVYLHELAHAALDPSIYVKENYSNGDYVYSVQVNEDKCNSLSTYSTALEESLANMIMLKYLKRWSKNSPSYGSKLFECARKFVEEQMPIYKFGNKLLDADVEYEKWRTYKDNNFCEENVKAWYEKCFKEGQINDNLSTNDILNIYTEVF